MNLFFTKAKGKTPFLSNIDVDPGQPGLMRRKEDADEAL